jgi:hypothetical protein
VVKNIEGVLSTLKKSGEEPLEDDNENAENVSNDDDENEDLLNDQVPLLPTEQSDAQFREAVEAFKGIL